MGNRINTTATEDRVEGLAMPHSPRWHNNQLWVLESGAVTIGRVDLAAKTYQPIAEVPGFTRGLDFCGDLVFIGLSQVRESAVFSGIPIAAAQEGHPDESLSGSCPQTRDSCSSRYR